MVSALGSCRGALLTLLISREVGVGATSAVEEDVHLAAPPTSPVDSCWTAPQRDHAAVTLISSNEGYPSGAMAIAGALHVLGSRLRRIVLVTPVVTAHTRQLLSNASWEVVEVTEIRCNQKLGPKMQPDRYDLGEAYQKKKEKWITTCTKIHSWNLLDLKRVLFLDADTLPIAPIDALMRHPSAFAAAPDAFPADQFNAGVMLIEPSAERFRELQRWNLEHGTAEGGDQGMLNDYFAEWFYNAWDAAECGRLPWGFNVPAASHASAKTLARMQSRDEPSIAHFVGGAGKPWHLYLAKAQGNTEVIPDGVLRLMDAWEMFYWLAKKGRLCDGTFSEHNRQELRGRLEVVGL